MLVPAAGRAYTIPSSIDFKWRNLAIYSLPPIGIDSITKNITTSPFDFRSIAKAVGLHSFSKEICHSFCFI